MNRLIIILLAGIFLTQCKKDKKDEPPPDLRKGLMAYFQLNGNFDDSANALDVSYGGFMSQIKNRHGYSNRAIFFNGGLFSFTTPYWRASPITIALWVKPNDLTTDAFLVRSNEQAFGILQQQSKIGLEIINPEDISAQATITTEWTHVACTYDGQDIKTYINGKLVETAHHPGVADVTTAVMVGAASLPEWKGGIDDVRFYNRVLSAEEIRHLYAL